MGRLSEQKMEWKLEWRNVNNERERADLSQETVRKSEKKI